MTARCRASARCRKPGTRAYRRKGYSPSRRSCVPPLSHLRRDIADVIIITPAKTPFQACSENESRCCGKRRLSSCPWVEEQNLAGEVRLYLVHHILIDRLPLDTGSVYVAPRGERRRIGRVAAHDLLHRDGVAARGLHDYGVPYRVVVLLGCWNIALPLSNI